jgi:predicted NAD-dependent protein-ADP-ribosyltransferase YbiA (DUF1768 family)
MPAGIGKPAKGNGDPLRYAKAVLDALKLGTDVTGHDVIQFMFKSANHPGGLGTGERLSSGSNRDTYSKFVEQDGRKVLSNMFASEIVVDGHRYPSVEHAFHAGKAFLSGDCETAAKFMCSGEYGGIDAMKVKAKGGKKGIVMTREQIAEWDEKRSAEWMERCIRARVVTDELFRSALASTGSAILVHQTRGTQDLRLSAILHKVRSELLL